MTVRPAETLAIPLTDRLATVLSELGRIVVGKPTQLRLALACMLARGHLLIEDIPGVGKSTLAQAIAGTLGLHYARVQFTSDLLPADVLGVSIFDPDTHEFRFHAGPIFIRWCWPTRSIARPRRRRARCSKPWKNARFRSMA